MPAISRCGCALPPVNIGYLVGVDQAYYRQHAVNMNATMFSSGTPKGQLIDLRQRWQSFEAVFSGVGAELGNAAELHAIARRTLSGHALKLANYAYARRVSIFPVAEAEALAYEIDPGIGSSMTGRAFSNVGSARGCRHCLCIRFGHLPQSHVAWKRLVAAGGGLVSAFDEVTPRAQSCVTCTLSTFNQIGHDQGWV